MRLSCSILSISEPLGRQKNSMWSPFLFDNPVQNTQEERAINQRKNAFAHFYTLVDWKIKMPSSCAGPCHVRGVCRHAQYFLRKLLALGWLPYARRPSLPFFMLAPRAMSTRGGVGKPKDLATLTRSRLLMLKTLRKLWDA